MVFVRQVRLLLWKNWILQRKRVTVSVCEILFPLFFVCLLWLVRQNFDGPQAVQERKYPIYLINGSRLMNRRTNFIGVSPAGKAVEVLTSEIAKCAEKDLNLNLTFRIFSDEKAMEEIAADVESSLVTGITFLNVKDDGSEIPKDVEIAIRPPFSDWKTDLMYEATQIEEQRTHSPNSRYFKAGILDMQALIGRALVQYWLKKRGENPQELKFVVGTHRMPYPTYYIDAMMGVVQNTLPFMLCTSLIISVIINTKNLVYEKEKKLKESMRLMGLLLSAHWASWILTFCIYLVPVLLLMTVILTIETENGSILQHSSPGVIFLFLVTYGIATITFSFMIASMVTSANAGAVISGVLFYLTYVSTIYLTKNYTDMTKLEKLSLAMMPNGAMWIGCRLIGLYEGIGVGARWGNILNPPNIDDNISLIECILMLVFDSFGQLLCYWYLDNVYPGDFGVPKPYYFCFMKSYWSGKSEEDTANVSDRNSLQDKTVRFEAEPVDLKKGIEIKRLTKMFGAKTVVDGMNLSMYEGEITVLLGHNGAGKSTTMHMLTGFIPSSSGTATINGYDINKDLFKVRNSLGLCPQHDVLFDMLTVRQHLEFFARLKGLSKNEANGEIDPLLEHVGLIEKTFEISRNLSGGQKRKLSVAIALIGGSKIVILDEPSSGLDPGARRLIWDLLQKNKEGRTILLTTHYMDEADALGDRIAIMAHGVVQCYGTSMFLKKLYGTGYTLVVVKLPNCNVQLLTTKITSFIPSAKLISVVNYEVTYRLPEDQTSQFPGLLEYLDENSAKLGISGFGTSHTTLEEVFLKVGESVEEENDKNNANNNQETIDIRSQNVDDEKSVGTVKSGMASQVSVKTGMASPVFDTMPNGRNVALLSPQTSDIREEFTESYTKNTGAALEISRMRAIFVKKMLAMIRSPIFTLVQFLQPVILVWVILIIIASSVNNKPKPPLTLDMNKFMSTVIPTFTTSPQNESIEKLKEVYRKQFDKRHDVQNLEFDGMSLAPYYDEYFLKEIEEMGISKFNEKVIVGFQLTKLEWLLNLTKERIDIDDGDIKLGEYIAAISHYNAQPLHADPIGINYVMNAILQYYLDDSYSLQFVMHPFEKKTEEKMELEISEGALLSILLTFTLAILMALFIHYYIKEREIGAKHLQMMSGASPLNYWLPSFMCDFIPYLGTCVLVMLLFYIYDQGSFIGAPRTQVIFLILVLHGWACLPWIYLLQFLFRIPSSGITATICFDILGSLFLPTALDLFFYLTSGRFKDILHSIVIAILPSYRLVSALSNFLLTAYTQDCPELGDYFAFEEPGIGYHILVYVICGFVCFTTIFLVEYKILQRVLYFVFGLIYGKDPSGDLKKKGSQIFETDVQDEWQRINALSSANLNTTDSVLLYNLYKKYGFGLHSKVAVDHVCVGIPKNECFGLLGQNGAGKTTTFKLLTGDVMASGGNAFVDGHDIINNMTKVQANIGYCPQSYAVIDELTPSETLTLYGRLRGISEKSLMNVTDNLIDLVILSSYRNVLAGNLSGGNKRKLSTAIALVGLPPFIMLDEPTAGVDPQARRMLWNVFSRVRQSGHTMVLTSHSMEECDALCTRLTIMVNGNFVCLGSPQHIKNKYGQGYTLIAQLGFLEDTNQPAPSLPLFQFLSYNLPSVNIFDEHMNYVQFHVPDASVKLAHLFGLLEQAKLDFNVIDYSVQQTTLEQIFLAFTRVQRPENDAAFNP